MESSRYGVFDRMKVIERRPEFYIQRCPCGALLQYGPEDITDARMSGRTAGVIRCCDCGRQLRATFRDVLTIIKHDDILNLIDYDQDAVGKYGA